MGGLTELLTSSDVVSLHARSPGPPIIGEAELALMRRGSYLINTSRANQIDYEAMARALRLPSPATRRPPGARRRARIRSSAS